MQHCRIKYGNDRYSGDGYYVEVREFIFWLRLGDGWFPTVFSTYEAAKKYALSAGYAPEEEHF